jgi:hypothetical protein
VGFEVQGGHYQLSKVPKIVLVLILHFGHPYLDLQYEYKVGPWLSSSQIEGGYHCNIGNRWNN